jgi:ribosomal protein S27AE
MSDNSITNKNRRKVRLQRLTDGVCVRCLLPQAPERIGKWYCQACQVRYTGSKKHLRLDKQKAVAKDVRVCLQCDQSFLSPDKRLIRICPRCKESNEVVMAFHADDALLA